MKKRAERRGAAGAFRNQLQCGSWGWGSATVNGEAKLTPTFCPVGEEEAGGRYPWLRQETSWKDLLQEGENWNHLCPLDLDKSVEHLCQHVIVLCSKRTSRGGGWGKDCKTNSNSTKRFGKFPQINVLKIRICSPEQRAHLPKFAH